MATKVKSEPKLLCDKWEDHNFIIDFDNESYYCTKCAWWQVG